MVSTRSKRPVSELVPVNAAPSADAESAASPVKRPKRSRGKAVKKEVSTKAEPKRSARSSTKTAVKDEDAPEPGAKRKAKPAAKKDAERESGVPAYFLMKSEPETRMEKGVDMRFGIDDLVKCKDQTEPWDGVRNHEAKNTMRAMRKGDRAFFYHSNCKKVRPGIVGVVEIVREAYPDYTAWDSSDPHFDPKSSKEAPRWWMVDVQFVKKFPRCVTLDEIKKHDDLQEMQLVKRGRISVQSVRKDEWGVIVALAESTE